MVQMKAVCAGNWDSVSSTLAASGTRTLAVFLTDAGSVERATSPARSADASDSPFSMDQFALAMLRVGLRQKHVGMSWAPHCIEH